MAALGWGILGGGAQGEKDDDEIEPLAESSAPLTLRSLYMEEFDEGGKRLDLWGRSARFSRKNGRVRLEDIRVIWSGSDEKPDEGFELRGRAGTYDLSGQIAVIRGDVEMFAWNGYVVRTDMVRYDHRRNRIEGPGAVHIEGPEGITEGVGLQVDMEEETFVLQEQVRTIIRPSVLEKAKKDLPQ